MEIGPSKEPVVFFDGVCNLCNGSVNFLLDRDRRKRLRFAPLQGSTFDRIKASRPDLAGTDSFVLWDDRGLHQKSSAALRVLTSLGRLWRLAAVGYVLPRPLRDRLYDFVAKRRYGWFGKADSCRIPTPELKARFLD